MNLVKLKEYLGNEIECIGYFNGRFNIQGVLTLISDKGIYLSYQKQVVFVPFYEKELQILAILSDTEVLYLNNSIHLPSEIEDIDSSKLAFLFNQKENSSVNTNLEMNSECEELTEKEIRGLYVLYNLFDTDISYGFHNNKLCFEKKDNEWIVYIVDNGNIGQLQKFSDIYLAMFDIIHKISDSCDHEKDFLYAFSKMISKENILEEQKSYVLTKIKK